jgi:hypothetical protein
MGNKPKKRSILPLVLCALAGVIAQIAGASLSDAADMFLTAGTVVAIAVGSALVRYNVVLAVAAFAVGNLVTMIFIGHP